MIEVVKFKVESYDIDHLDLQFEIDNTPEDPLDYRIEIHKSVDGAEGPYGHIANVVHNQYVFRDPDVHRLHYWREYYYKIRIVTVATGAYKDFGPEWHRHKPDRIALEMQRREQLLWKEFAGRKALIFPAITIGPRCTRCWNITERGNTIGRSKQQQCASCFDSTFVGGYCRPMWVWMQFDPSPTALQRTDMREQASTNTTARLCAFPPIKPRDMIVDDGGDRWEVEKMTPTCKLGAVIRQELELHFIQRADIRYKVPVTFDEITQPEREFTRPMDIQPLMPRI